MHYFAFNFNNSVAPVAFLLLWQQLENKSARRWIILCMRTHAISIRKNSVRATATNRVLTRISASKSCTCSCICQSASCALPQRPTVRAQDTHTMRLRSGEEIWEKTVEAKSCLPTRSNYARYSRLTGCCMLPCCMWLVHIYQHYKHVISYVCVHDCVYKYALQQHYRLHHRNQCKGGILIISLMSRRLFARKACCNS